jgi:hypothetical protein
MADSKEFFFGGLPETLFGQIVAFLQGVATPGGASSAAEATAALTALVSLTKSEHAAAASSVSVRQMDAVFLVIDLQNEFGKVQAAPAGAALVAELAILTQKLDALTNFWLGK